jgi:hypothetical protein
MAAIVAVWTDGIELGPDPMIPLIDRGAMLQNCWVARRHVRLQILSTDEVLISGVMSSKHSSLSSINKKC